MISLPCSLEVDSISSVLPIIEPAFVYNPIERAYVETYTFPLPNTGFWVLSTYDTIVILDCISINVDDPDTLDNVADDITLRVYRDHSFVDDSPIYLYNLFGYSEYFISLPTTEMSLTDTTNHYMVYASAEKFCTELYLS